MAFRVIADAALGAANTVPRVNAGATAVEYAKLVAANIHADAAVALSQLATQAQATVAGRASGAGTGVPSALTATQVQAVITTAKTIVRASVNGSDQSISAGVETTVDYDTEQIDTQSEFNTGTNTYTASATRNLRVHAVIGCDSGAGDLFQLRIKKNGSEVANAKATMPTGTDEISLSISDIVQVVANDTILVTVHQNSGTRTIRGGTTRSFLTIEEI